MYSVYAVLPTSGTTVIYDDRLMGNEYRLIDPKLELAVNSAGTFTVSIPPTNIAYSSLTCFTTDLYITRDGTVIWYGRVINESLDFWNNRRITCEGALAFLNDTVQPHWDNGGYDVRQFISYVLGVHNGRHSDGLANSHQIFCGNVTVSDTTYSIWSVDGETTLECIQKYVIDKFGGFLSIRRDSSNQLLLDCLKSARKTAKQQIRFGSNLLDFSKTLSMTDLCTCVYPRGEKREDGTYLTVKNTDAADGSIYVKSDTGIANYGLVERTVDWPNVTDADVLFELAQTYLESSQFADLSIDISAVDLHSVFDFEEAIDLGDRVRCVSEPHGMNADFMVTKISLPLDQPDKTVYSLTSEEKLSVSSTISSILAKK